MRRASASARSYLAHDPLSTMNDQKGILMDIIRSSKESLKSRNLSFLGPDRADNLSKAHS
jgi:hypothetical protein